MDFETIKNAIIEFMNQPVPIISITVGSLLLSILVIITKTSIGKRAIKKFTKQYDELVAGFDNVKNVTTNTYNKLEQYYHDKLAVIQSQYNDLCSLIMVIAENINNVKIKNAVKEFVSKVDLSKKDFEGYVEQRINDAKNYYEQEIVNKYETELLEYKKQLDELINQMKEGIENGEERENTTNTDTTQE